LEKRIKKRGGGGKSNTTYGKKEAYEKAFSSGKGGVTLFLSSEGNSGHARGHSGARISKRTGTHLVNTKGTKRKIPI